MLVARISSRLPIHLPTTGVFEAVPGSYNLGGHSAGFRIFVPFRTHARVHTFFHHPRWSLVVGCSNVQLLLRMMVILPSHWRQGGHLCVLLLSPMHQCVALRRMSTAILSVGYASRRFHSAQRAVPFVKDGLHGVHMHVSTNTTTHSIHE
jgi:hypothetical protein